MTYVVQSTLDYCTLSYCTKLGYCTGSKKLNYCTFLKISNLSYYTMHMQLAKKSKKRGLLEKIWWIFASFKKFS